MPVQPATTASLGRASRNALICLMVLHIVISTVGLGWTIQYAIYGVSNLNYPYSTTSGILYNGVLDSSKGVDDAGKPLHSARGLAFFIAPPVAITVVTLVLLGVEAFFIHVVRVGGYRGRISSNDRSDGTKGARLSRILMLYGAMIVYGAILTGINFVIWNWGVFLTGVGLGTLALVNFIVVAVFLGKGAPKRVKPAHSV